MAYNPSMYMPSYSQSFSYAQPVNGLVSVTGIDGARAYQLPPNSSMPLFDANDDILYVKTTDGAGFPTVKAFRFEPIEPERSQDGAFVSREEYDELVDRVNRLAASRAEHVGKAADDGE